MDNIFQKGAILNMVQLIDYSGGGIISKQIIKNKSVISRSYISTKGNL